MKLETKRLILREWKLSDIDDLVEGLNDLNVSKWLARVAYPYTKKDAKDWIEFCKKESRKKNRDAYHFVIELKSEKKVIGGIGVENIDRFNGTATGGVWIHEKYHGKCYATEAYDVKLNFIFNKLKLRRLEQGYFRGNIPSSKLHKKLGFVVEGLKRKALKCKADGIYKDEYIVGLLKEDWKKKH